MFATDIPCLPLADLTPYLAGFAAGLFLLSLALLFCEARPLVRVRHRFRALPRFQQVLLVLSIGVMTASAQKSGTHEASVVLPMPAALNAVDGEEEDFLATNLLAGVRSRISAQFPVVLPFAFTGGGIVHTNATVDLDGVVAFHPILTPAPLTLSSQNVNLLTLPRFPNHTVVAPYWDALYASPTATPAARILMDDVVAWDGRRYWVVEYENIRLQAERSAEGQVATFQVAVCEDEPSTIYVRYVHLASVFDGTSATIGAQLPGGACVLQLSFDAPFAVTDGTVVAYRFCAGTDPLTAEDSDHDGVPDVIERRLGANPFQPDSDGDGLNDGWEYANRNQGFDLAVDNATDNDPNNDGDADPDGDGLTNGEECEWGTNPTRADTDGDGVSDDEELRVKIEVAPRLESLARCRQAFGNFVTMKTSGMRPDGVAVTLPEDAMLVHSSDRSEIRFSKTRTQLKTLGLLPTNDDDGVDEMASVDIVQTHFQENRTCFRRGKPGSRLGRSISSAMLRRRRAMRAVLRRGLSSRGLRSERLSATSRRGCRRTRKIMPGTPVRSRRVRGMSISTEA